MCDKFILYIYKVCCICITNFYNFEKKNFIQREHIK